MDVSDANFEYYLQRYFYIQNVGNNQITLKTLGGKPTPIQSPGLHEHADERRDNLRKSNAANERVADGLPSERDKSVLGVIVSPIHSHSSR